MKPWARDLPHDGVSDPAARGSVRPSEHASIRVWPPLLWPAMAFASLLILMGLGSWKTPALVAGAVLVWSCRAAGAIEKAVGTGAVPNRDGQALVGRLLKSLYLGPKALRDLLRADRRFSAGCSRWGKTSKWP